MEQLFHSLKMELESTLGYENETFAKKELGFYLMDYRHWMQLHAFNDGIPPANAKNMSNLLSEIS